MQVGSSPMNRIPSNGAGEFLPLSGLRQSQIGSQQPTQVLSYPAKCNRSQLYPVCLLFVAAAFYSGCAWTTREQSEEVIAEREKIERAYQKVNVANQELEGKLARLQLLLLEKETLNKELSKKLEEAILEVVRAKAKLRSMESKAEAASTLAEGEIALKALKTNEFGLEKDTDSIKAEELLKASGLELKKENYSGALYLATQAKVIINQGQERSKGREKMPMMAGEVPFAIPLSLRAVGPSKIREGPGLDFKVLFALHEGAALVGYSYKGPWVRVRAEDGRGGWIYYNLIGGR